MNFVKSSHFVLRLLAGKEKLPLRHHPWIFSNAILPSAIKPKNGSIVEIQTQKGDFIAWGTYSSHSEIRVRLLEWEKSRFPDAKWLVQKIKEAIARRKLLSFKQTDTYRVIFGEADGLPGIIADRLGDFVVIRLATVYADQHRTIIAKTLIEELAVKGVYEKSTDPSLSKEGLKQQIGNILGQEPPETITITENGILYPIKLEKSQKTGFYCDQRDNRRIAAEFCKDKRVLDCFCYTGGFSLNAIKAGVTEVVAIDSSEEALNILQEAFSLNHFNNNTDKVLTTHCTDVSKWLRQDNSFYDVIILDPPKLASQKKGVPKALRAYKDLNLRAMRHIKSGGILITFSCSGRVSQTEFQQSLAWAAQDAGVTASIVQVLHQAGDHPVRLSYPESAYLKGFILEIHR